MLTKAVECVRQFHRHVGAPTPDQPCLISCSETVARDLCSRLWELSQTAAIAAQEYDDMLAARLAMALEELAEWMAAHADGNLVAAADAWADRAYVLLGDAVAAGLPAEGLFAAVHASNMTKQPIAGGSGKGVKGPEYRPPNIASILKQVRRQ
jgi:predicted HAD superfamily Cof-like phosphohydrolase